MTSFPDAALTWNQRFSAPHYIFGREPNVYLREHAGLLAPASRVLCVADGEGRNSVWLAQQGHHVTAFDIAELGVAKARTLAQEAGVSVEFHVASCDDFSWSDADYDAVVAVFVQFADPEMRARLFTRMQRALKPGGVLVLQGYTPRQLDYRTGGPPNVSHLYTPALVHEAFASLQIIELREYDAVLSEGTQHSGQSALLGLVARKP